MSFVKLANFFNRPQRKEKLRHRHCWVRCIMLAGVCRWITNKHSNGGRVQLKEEAPTDSGDWDCFTMMVRVFLAILRKPRSCGGRRRIGETLKPLSIWPSCIKKVVELNVISKRVHGSSGSPHKRENQRHN